MSWSLLIQIATGIILTLIGFIVSSHKQDTNKKFDTLFEKLDGMMSKEMCSLYHLTHAKEHERLEKDLNGYGERLNRANVK